MWALAFLEVDRRDHAVVGFDNVDPGDHAEALGRQEHRARLGRSIIERIRRGKRRATGIGARMDATALGCIAALGPVALDPLEIGQARAIDPCIDHARGHERDVGVGRGAGALINHASHFLLWSPLLMKPSEAMTL